MTNYGIDYGRGLANVDNANGIRYGVISSHSLEPEAISDAMANGADYGPATCPMCGNEAAGNTSDCIECDNAGFDMLRADYHCHGVRCGKANPTKFDGQSFAIYCFSSDMAFGDDEPQGWTHEQDGYVLTNCLDSDVFVIKSPYYTYAQFCSPCVPGACNLDHPVKPEGFLKGHPKTYCLGPDWFEDGIAPYRMFKVSDDTEVPRSTASEVR